MGSMSFVQACDSARDSGDFEQRNNPDPGNRHESMTHFAILDNRGVPCGFAAIADTSDPAFVKYQLPGSGSQYFVRLEVLVP